MNQVLEEIKTSPPTYGPSVATDNTYVASDVSSIAHSIHLLQQILNLLRQMDDLLQQLNNNDMTDPVLDSAILCDTVRKLQRQVNDLQRELVTVRVTMFREIQRLMRALLGVFGFRNSNTMRFTFVAWCIASLDHAREYATHALVRWDRACDASSAAHTWKFQHI
ncbi:hypothetical protein FXO37_19969 [Capsicum annuum]|nr:hypothetical protein FXO37_19969 [Capsicum annuum]